VDTLTNGASPTSVAFRIQATVSIVARVPILLSSALYSADLTAGATPVGVADTLSQGSGICGQHVELGLALFERLGIPARDVQVFYGAEEPLNHTVVEVEWDNDWHMVDLTYGFVPHRGSLSEALSFDEARATNHRDGLHHSMIPWRRATEDVADILDFLSEPMDHALYGGIGSVVIELNEGYLPLRHPDNVYLIGQRQHLGSLVDAQLTFRVPTGDWNIEIFGTISEATELCIGDKRYAVEIGSNAILVNASGPLDLELAMAPETPTGQFWTKAVRAEKRT
jgi:hypothetical protein